MYSPSFIGPEGSLSCIQKPATDPYLKLCESVHILPPYPLMSTLLLFYPHLGLPSCLFPSGFLTNILYSHKTKERKSLNSQIRENAMKNGDGLRVGKNMVLCSDGRHKFRRPDHFCFFFFLFHALKMKSTVILFHGRKTKMFVLLVNLGKQYAWEGTRYFHASHLELIPILLTYESHRKLANI